MKTAKKSIFSLKSFVILKSTIDFIPSENPVEIPVDINYQIKVIRNSSEMDDKEVNGYQIFLEIHGNQQEKEVGGYKFFISSGAIFTFEENVEPEILDKYLKFSGIPMMISMCRGYLLNMTSYGVYGKYQLPSIDIQSII